MTGRANVGLTAGYAMSTGIVVHMSETGTDKDQMSANLFGDSGRVFIQSLAYLCK